jgi:hypothetical protein
MERRQPSLLRLLSGAAALGLTFVLLLAPRAAAAAPACTGLHVKQSKAPSKTVPGRRFRLSYTVRNKEATRDVALGLIVPPGVIVGKTSANARNSKHVVPANASIIDAKLERVFGAYWPTDTLVSKKSRKFSVTLQVAMCDVMPDALLFQARVMEIHNNTIVCNQDFAQQKVCGGSKRMDGWMDGWMDG